MNKKQSLRWQIAAHEAGHAVAALLLGIPDVGAVIFVEGDRGCGLATTAPKTATSPMEHISNYSKIYERHRNDSWEELLSMATFVAAGHASEDLLINTTRTETAVLGGDEVIIRALCNAAIPTSCDPLVEISFGFMASARARALLKPDLWRVERVAKALDKRGMLSADEVVKVMYPHLNEIDFARLSPAGRPGA